MEVELRMSVDASNLVLLLAQGKASPEAVLCKSVEMAGGRKLLILITGGVRCLRDRNEGLPPHSSSHLPQVAVG